MPCSHSSLWYRQEEEEEDVCRIRQCRMMVNVNWKLQKSQKKSEITAALQNIWSDLIPHMKGLLYSASLDAQFRFLACIWYYFWTSIHLIWVLHLLSPEILCMLQEGSFCTLFLDIYFNYQEVWRIIKKYGVFCLRNIKQSLYHFENNYKTHK